MPFQIVRNDITKVEADVIVNTANPNPKIGSGTDFAIYNAAGKDKLLAERMKIGPIKRGDIAVTPAFDLKAKYIIHAVGSGWLDGKHNEINIVRSCYAKSLAKAKELSAKSIAFPLISSGNYGFPKQLALDIALSEIGKFLLLNDMQVYLVVFDLTSFELSKELTRLLCNSVCISSFMTIGLHRALHRLYKAFFFKGTYYPCNGLNSLYTAFLSHCRLLYLDR